ncbi:MAG TPA: prephenate dehydrogenase/arogenate dehydrogenase family protein [Acidimicrobiia bacterium]
MTGTALISGTGLIGTSIGLGLRSAGWQVVGWDPDPATTAEARRRGALDRVTDHPEDHSGIDLVVLAGPLPAIVATLRSLRSGALITDVAGVKTPVVEAAANLPRFVGGHPMAGGATRGPDLASAHLFHGAAWVLTTDGASEGDLETIEEVVRTLGANPLRMTADEHDSAVARVSHLPHLLAGALVRIAARREAMGLAGGGFRDLTRVAASDTSWWPDVLQANATEVADAISELQADLEGARARLLAGDKVAITGSLEEARAIRSSLGEHHAQIRVILIDRPGELARVGHALEASHADVRDIQLRHGEHGGGGVLTISVTPRSARALREALEAEGFTLEV